MAKRIYELSKEYGVATKELLELLKKHGISLTSLGVVTPEVVELVEKNFGKKAQAAVVPDQAEKKEILQQTPVGAQEEKVVKIQQKTLSPEIQPAEIKKPVETKVEAKPSIEHKPVSKPKSQPLEEVGPSEIVMKEMSVAEMAEKSKKTVSDVILTLLKQGIKATKNQLLPEKTVGLLAGLYGLKVIQKPQEKPREEKDIRLQTEEGTLEERIPVVVVIGHVDHGKTTLLDYIRKTRVAAKEKGGITQHLGAYEVKTAHGNVVFLDTPGHEAFSLMRVRGIKVADIAILVIAADDGVMPQTIEAIKRAKEANIALVVAINKIDKASPGQIEIVKRQLAQYDLTPEEWGGTTVVVQISAKLGQGVDELLDVVVLQSQLMELKANISMPARGYVLESKIEKGRGPVATVICQHGILKIGDSFIAGETSGRVSSLVDTFGKRIKEAGPSIPVQVAGFDQLPQVGDSFEVVLAGTAKKALAAQVKPEIMAKRAPSEGNFINVIIKADNASSREALIGSIGRLKSEHRVITIVYAGVGDISESDIMLAADTASLIYGFHVKVQQNALTLVQKKNVVIKSFDIIYKLLEDVQELLESGKPIKMVSKKIGEATVLKVFDIKGLGVIAGSIVNSGRFIRDGKVVIWRGRQKVGEGSIKGLQRERKAVKEVHAGFECGFLVDGFDTWEVDDRVECFQDVPA